MWIIDCVKQRICNILKSSLQERIVVVPLVENGASNLRWDGCQTKLHGVVGCDGELCKYNKTKLTDIFHCVREDKVFMTTFFLEENQKTADRCIEE